jgi:hypothetical protein
VLEVFPERPRPETSSGLAATSIRSRGRSNELQRAQRRPLLVLLHREDAIERELADLVHEVPNLRGLPKDST